MKKDEDEHRNTEGFEETLDVCWNWAISGGTTATPAALVDAEFVHDDIQSSTGTALSAYATLWHLVQWIIDRDKSNIEPPICNAFDIFDSFLYDHNSVSYDTDRERDAKRHELVVAEVSRQKEQLEKILSSDWKKADWSAFREEVERQMLLGTGF